MTTLTDKLTTPGPITLDDTERAAVAAAFAELARSAAVRATHESLLASFGRDARDVVRAVDDAFARMTTHAGDRAAEQSGARDTLESARAALTAEVQASTDLRSLIAAAVRFAFAVALPT
jgi:hypothetical protein